MAITSSKEAKKAVEATLPQQPGSPAVTDAGGCGLVLTHFSFLTITNPRSVKQKLPPDSYTLIYCVAGTGVINHGKLRLSLAENEFYLGPAITPRKEFVALCANWQLYDMSFTGELAGLLLDKAFPACEKATCHTTARESILDKLRTIHGLRRFEDSEQAADANAHTLNALMKLVYNATPCLGKQQREGASHLLSFMEQNINSRLTVQDFAKDYGKSVSRYSAKFKKEFSASPIDYFNKLKIEKAIQQLLLTDRTIKSIGSELGFPDPYYFSRIFSKVTGLSPKKYKDQNKVR